MLRFSLMVVQNPVSGMNSRRLNRNLPTSDYWKLFSFQIPCKISADHMYQSGIELSLCLDKDGWGFVETELFFRYKLFFNNSEELKPKKQV